MDCAWRARLARQWFGALRAAGNSVRREMLRLGQYSTYSIDSTLATPLVELVSAKVEPVAVT
jgi:hypothetical protein